MEGRAWRDRRAIPCDFKHREGATNMNSASFKGGIIARRPAAMVVLALGLAAAGLAATNGFAGPKPQPPQPQPLDKPVDPTELPGAVKVEIDRLQEQARGRREIFERAANQGVKRPLYRFRVGDEIFVGIPGLDGAATNAECLVRLDGTISLGPFGDVSVVGLNRAEAKEKIIEHLRNHLLDHQLDLVRADESGKAIAVPWAESQSVYVDESPTLRSMTAAEFALAARGPETVRIVSATNVMDEWLKKTASVPFKNPTPLKEVLDFLCGSSKNPDGSRAIKSYLDPNALELARIDQNAKAQLELKTTNREALQLIVAQLGLVAEIRGDLIRVTHPELVGIEAR